MYIQPTSEDAMGIQLPSNYAGTAFATQAPVEDATEETEETTAETTKKEEEVPTVTPATAPASAAPKARGGILSFLSGSPLLSSFLPPPRKGNEGEQDIMQWILVGIVVLMLFNDSDDDILPLLLLLLLWK